MPTPADERIVGLLERILKVLAIQVGSDKSTTERARLLKIAGLDNQTIALGNALQIGRRVAALVRSHKGLGRNFWFVIGFAHHGQRTQ